MITNNICVLFTDALDKVRLESQNGNDKFTLSQVAQIKMKDGMFIVDMASSPEVQCEKFIIKRILS